MKLLRRSSQRCGTIAGRTAALKRDRARDDQTVVAETSDREKNRFAKQAFTNHETGCCIIGKVSVGQRRTVKKLAYDLGATKKPQPCSQCWALRSLDKATAGGQRVSDEVVSGMQDYMPGSWWKELGWFISGASGGRTNYILQLPVVKILPE